MYFGRKNRKNTVEFHENTVKKYCDEITFESEVMKTRLAADIGKKSSLFRVPEIVSVDEVNQVYTMEKIPDFVPLRQLNDTTTY